MNPIDLFLHLDTTLEWAAQTYGPWIYALLFAVLFCETGLVITPFLPGDSLLFAAGALAGAGHLDARILFPAVIIAPLLGDTVNYFVGRVFGLRILRSEMGQRFVNPAYVERTRAFYDRHGGKTVLLARFFPIVRTFAPFMAGVGIMSLRRFWTFSVGGTFLWVGIFAGGGYFFGNIPVVEDNLTVGILVMVAVSFLPSIWHVVQSKREERLSASDAEKDGANPSE